MKIKCLLKQKISLMMLFMIAFLGILWVSSSNVNAASAKSPDYYVTKSSVGVYADAGTSDKKLGVLSKGTPIEVTKTKKVNGITYGRIVYNCSKTGWVSLKKCKKSGMKTNVYYMFIDAGYTKAAACGIMGTIDWISRWDAYKDEKSITGFDSYGLFDVICTHKKSLMDWSGKHGYSSSKPTAEAQINWFIQCAVKDKWYTDALSGKSMEYFLKNESLQKKAASSENERAAFCASIMCMHFYSSPSRNGDEYTYWNIYSIYKKSSSYYGKEKYRGIKFSSEAARKYREQVKDFENSGIL